MIRMTESDVVLSITNEMCWGGRKGSDNCLDFKAPTSAHL